MIAGTHPVRAHPSAAEAAYLVRTRAAIRVQYNGSLPRGTGSAQYFTLVTNGGRGAIVVKLCEDGHGRITGSSSVSDGEPSC
ncbi:MAG: hypothetical protein JO064_00615 [Actinobacteria bacterium]|nr:hypothetical protein [Actinomycetota bacterium]